VGVVNSWNEFIPGHIRLDKIALVVKAGMRMVGGVPFEFHTEADVDGDRSRHNQHPYVQDKKQEEEIIGINSVTFGSEESRIFMG
jgi:dihydroxyacid dehydratase/phosphogluconate dehydratase